MGGGGRVPVKGAFGGWGREDTYHPTFPGEGKRLPPALHSSCSSRMARALPSSRLPAYWKPSAWRFKI